LPYLPKSQPGTFSSANLTDPDTQNSNPGRGFTATPVAANGHAASLTARKKKNKYLADGFSLRIPAFFFEKPGRTV